MRATLAIAILKSRRSQRSIAYGAGIAEGRLSSIVNGWVVPRPEERALIADELEREDTDELFADDGIAGAAPIEHAMVDHGPRGRS
jgi:hypothetical protein